MKILLGIVMILALGAFALAQETTAPRAATGFSISTDKVVKNAPFSAEAVSESVQTLADGNRIVNKSTSKLYRNSEGRFRREMADGSGGLFGSFYSYGPGVTILDPVVGQKYLLDSKLYTATASAFKALPDMPGFTFKSDLTDEQKKALEEKLAAISKGDLSAEQKAELISKLKGELKIKGDLKVITPPAPLTAITVPDGRVLSEKISIAGGGNVGVAVPHARVKYETKTEQLGVQNFEGVDAEGTRTTTIIPAGAIGNERPIETTYERWYSKELDMVVMSKHYDPRTGEQTYKLTNIVRAEPDPSLFALPSGYKVFTTPLSPAAKAEVEAATAAKAATVTVVPAAPAPVAAPKAKPQ